MQTCTRRRLTLCLQGSAARAPRKKITFDDFWRRTSPSCQLRIMTQRNAVNNVRRLGDTILVPPEVGENGGWGRGGEVGKMAGGCGEANIYLHSFGKFRSSPVQLGPRPALRCGTDQLMVREPEEVLVPSGVLLLRLENRGSRWIYERRKLVKTMRGGARGTRL